jgi:hypothetical protein
VWHCEYTSRTAAAALWPQCGRANLFGFSAVATMLTLYCNGVVRQQTFFGMFSAVASRSEEKMRAFTPLHGCTKWMHCTFACRLGLAAARDRSFSSHCLLLTVIAAVGAHVL